MRSNGSLKKNTKKAGKFSTAFLRITGILFLLLFFFTAAVFLIPGLVKIKSFYVISGSMEPQIPVGSMVYVKDCDMQELNEGDIVAFYSNGTVVTHRVTANDKEKRELYTKGDMNPIEDMQTVPYGSVIGKYVYHLPYMGYAGAFFSTFPGRLMLVMIGCIGLILTAYAKPDKRSE